MRSMNFCKLLVILVGLWIIGLGNETEGGGALGSPVASPEAYVTLLYGDEFLLGVRVLGKSIRDTGSTKDMVALVSDGVSDYAKSLLRADGWIVEKVSLLANPNQVRPTRFWGVYTKLKIFNMTKYKKERLNSGVMVVEPSKEVFNDMMSKVTTLGSYTGGDQGFLNAYYPGFANAHIFEPDLAPEVLNSRPVPEMERLSTLYNADVGLYMLANKWMVDEKELRVIHYTLGPLKPWDWWTSWLVKPVDVWQERSLCDHVRHLYYKFKSGGVLSYSAVSSSTFNSNQQFSSTSQSKGPSYLGGISVFICFFVAAISLGLSFLIIPRQVTPWTGLLLMYEWTFTLFFLLFGSYLHLISRWAKIMANRAGTFSAHPRSLDDDSGKGHQRQPSCCDCAAWYYGLGMAFLAVATPSLPCLLGITALFVRLGLMVVGGLILASFMTYAAEHLAIRSFTRGLEERDSQRSNDRICFLC